MNMPNRAMPASHNNRLFSLCCPISLAMSSLPNSASRSWPLAAICFAITAFAATGSGVRTTHSHMPNWSNATGKWYLAVCHRPHPALQTQVFCSASHPIRHSGHVGALSARKELTIYSLLAAIVFHPMMANGTLTVANIAAF